MSHRTLWLLSVCCFVSMASMRICDSLLPSLQAAFDLTVGKAAQAISAFALAYSLMQLIFGPLGDRFGKIRVIAFATIGCTIGNVAVAASGYFDQMLAARVLSGAAAAAIVPLTMAWIGDTVPYEQRQEVLARLLSATVFGMISGQWLGAVLADWINWRLPFAVLAVISLIAGFLVIRGDHGTQKQERNSSGSIGHRAIEVLSIPWARAILITTFIEGALAFSALSFMPVYAHTKFDIPMSEAGAIVALYGVGGLIYSRCAKLLVPRFGEINLALLGGVCLALAYGGLTLVNHWWSALPSCLLAGFGFYTLHNTLQIHATQMAPAARGTAVSLFSCFLFFGQSAGIFCAAIIVDRFSAVPIFLMSAVGLLILAAGFASLLSRRQARLMESTHAS